MGCSYFVRSLNMLSGAYSCDLFDRTFLWARNKRLSIPNSQILTTGRMTHGLNHKKRQQQAQTKQNTQSIFGGGENFEEKSVTSNV
uniref:Uncharacterized protein n=1 Tax=Oryza brachyantha TaxID=4533 RepID=J3LAS2_ORYBR